MHVSPRYHIHWLCEHSTPYVDLLFRSLSSDPEIDLTVHFVRLRLASHPWQSPVASGFHSRSYRTVLGLDWRLVWMALTDTQSFFVVGGWRDWTMRAVIAILSVRERPFALASDTPKLHIRRSLAKSLLRAVFIPWVFKHCSAIFTTGQPGLDAFQAMGANAAKLRNLPWFVALDQSESPESVALPKVSRLPTLLPARSDPNEVWFVANGRLIYRKGFDLAIQAFRRALDSFPGHQGSQLLIAGDGPEYDNLESLITASKLTGRVHLLGWLEPDEVAALLRLGDVFVHPARADPFPVAVLEAMAAGRAVIGSDAAGSVVDRVVHGVNGFVHHCGNVEELAEHMAFFMRYPDEAKRMGAQARRTAEQWPVSRGVRTIKDVLAEQARWDERLTRG